MWRRQSLATAQVVVTVLGGSSNDIGNSRSRRMEIVAATEVAIRFIRCRRKLGYCESLNVLTKTRRVVSKV